MVYRRLATHFRRTNVETFLEKSNYVGHDNLQLAIENGDILKRYDLDTAQNRERYHRQAPPLAGAVSPASNSASYPTITHNPVTPLDPATATSPGTSNGGLWEAIKQYVPFRDVFYHRDKQREVAKGLEDLYKELQRVHTETTVALPTTSWATVTTKRKLTVDEAAKIIGQRRYKASRSTLEQLAVDLGYVGEVQVTITPTVTPYSIPYGIPAPIVTAVSYTTPDAHAIRQSYEHITANPLTWLQAAPEGVLSVIRGTALISGAIAGGGALGAVGTGLYMLGGQMATGLISSGISRVARQASATYTGSEDSWANGAQLTGRLGGLAAYSATASLATATLAIGYTTALLVGSAGTRYMGNKRRQEARDKQRQLEDTLQAGGTDAARTAAIATDIQSAEKWESASAACDILSLLGLVGGATYKTLSHGSTPTPQTHPEPEAVTPQPLAESTSHWYNPFTWFDNNTSPTTPATQSTGDHGYTPTQPATPTTAPTSPTLETITSTPTPPTQPVAPTTTPTHPTLETITSGTTPQTHPEPAVVTHPEPAVVTTPPTIPTDATQFYGKDLTHTDLREVYDYHNTPHTPEAGHEQGLHIAKDWKSGTVSLNSLHDEHTPCDFNIDNTHILVEHYNATKQIDFRTLVDVDANGHYDLSGTDIAKYHGDGVQITWANATHIGDNKLGLEDLASWTGKHVDIPKESVFEGTVPAHVAPHYVDCGDGIHATHGSSGSNESHSIGTLTPLNPDHYVFEPGPFKFTFDGLKHYPHFGTEANFNSRGTGNGMIYTLDTPGSYITMQTGPGAVSVQDQILMPYHFNSFRLDGVDVASGSRNTFMLGHDFTGTTFGSVAGEQHLSAIPQPFPMPHGNLDDWNTNSFDVSDSGTPLVPNPLPMPTHDLDSWSTDPFGTDVPTYAPTEPMTDATSYYHIDQKVIEEFLRKHYWYLDENAIRQTA